MTGTVVSTTRIGRGRRLGSKALIVAAVLYWLFGGASDRSVDGVAIRFAHFGGYEDYQLWEDVIRRFSRRHPAIRVRQEYVVDAHGLYDVKMHRQAVSGTPPDVAMIQLGPFPQAAPFFEDLTDLQGFSSHENGADVASRAEGVTYLDPTGLQAFQIEGRQKALPVCGGSLLIYVNPECFERAAAFRGRPAPRPRDDWTMNDFQEIASFLTCDFDGDGRLDQFGFWPVRWIYYLPFLWSFGAEVIDPATRRWALTGSEAEEALIFYRRLMAGDDNGDRVCPLPPETPQIFQDVGFLTGKVGLCVNGPWFQPFLAKTKLARDYQVAPIPQGPGGRWTRVTWDGVAIAAGLPPQRRHAAETFVRFLLSAEVQDEIAATGRALPARARSTPAFARGPDAARRRHFIDALNYSRLQPQTPFFNALDRAINGVLSDYVDPRTSQTAAHALDRLARDPTLRPFFAPVPDEN